MLGREVVRACKKQGHQVVTWRSRLEILLLPKAEVIINCAGARPGRSPLEMAISNTMVSHRLASFGVRMVHMSTDCVYSGRQTPEKDKPDPIDLYGATKLAGESFLPHVLNVRGSFIGPQHGFLRWILDHPGPEIKGWANARWNGTFVVEMAQTLVELAEWDLTGTIHVSSHQEDTKANLVWYIVKKMRPDLKVRFVDEPVINRVLKTDVAVTPAVRYFL